MYEYFTFYLYPLAIEYGMSSKEFWYDNPDLFIAYRKSYIEKKKIKYEESNYKSWLEGLYIHNGNGILTDKLIVSIGKMFTGKGKEIKETYPSKPYDLTGNNKNKKDEKQEKRNQYFNSFNKFATLKKQFINKIKKGE